MTNEIKGRSADVARVAAVTGGGSGIGGEVVRQLHALGYRVAVLDIHLANAKAVADELNAQRQDSALAVSVNVSDAASVDAAFTAIEQHWSHSADVLVNSAGIMHVAPIMECSPEDFRKVMEVNVLGTFMCSQRAARGMIAQQYGRIVNLSSISAERAGVGRVAYGTSKTAISGLTRQLAMELGSYGITANAVAPGPVITPMTEKNYTPQTKEAFAAMIPAKRMGETREIADAIVYLCSDGAAYINGAVLPVDGGYVAAGVAVTAGVKA